MSLCTLLRSHTLSASGSRLGHDAQNPCGYWGFGASWGVGVSVVASSVGGMDEEELAALDAEGVLAAAGRARLARRLAEVEDLQLLAQWAALHATDPTDPEQNPDAAWARWVGDVLVHPGGEGTPGVQDFCLGEIAMVRGTGVGSTMRALADVLDLQHRLPKTWARCVAGEAETLVARRVAALSRHLPADRVGVVDVAVARIIDRAPAGRVLRVAEGKIVEADPGLHQERVEAELRRRYVRFSATDEHGLRTLIGRITAGDAVWIKATLDRVTQILGPRHPEATADELRSIALGWLARPAELLQLLLEHTEAETEGEPEAGESEAAEPEAAEPEAGEREVAESAGVCRALAFPADLLDALRAADLSALAPKTVLYVHLHQAALHGAAAAARVEGLGPVTLTALCELLGRTRLVVKPVLDLTARVHTTAYEHPESLKERVHLITGGDYWPYATSTSRHLDYDHPTPYHPPNPPPDDPDKPPDDPSDSEHRDNPLGQTGTHNSGPLGRRHHRWKTHAGYHSRQAGPGRYAWLTPHGLGYLVNHTGTRPLPPEHLKLILNAPPGLDIYPTG